MLAHGGQQRSVDPTLLPLRDERSENIHGELPDPGRVLLLRWGQLEADHWASPPDIVVACPYREDQLSARHPYWPVGGSVLRVTV